MVYKDKTIVFATMHGKERQAARLFKAGLDARIITPDNLNTDTLGTFSGEVERPADALKTVQKKCRLGLKRSGHKLGLASEGSFGPHPLIGFIPAGREILYFIDRINGFETYETDLFEQTNFAHRVVERFSDLDAFLKRALFPSHAIILRPHVWTDKSVIAKGVQDYDEAVRYFHRFKDRSEDGKVWAETDMRAHLNPTRRKTLIQLSKKLVRHLATPCPSCGLPGWRKVDIETGLPCNLCGLPTENVKADIFGCVKCKHQETKPRPEQSIDPMFCGFCNP